jgi:hypothetical protein
MQLDDERRSTRAVDLEAFVRAERQETQVIRAIGATRFDTGVGRALRESDAQVTILWQTAQRLEVRADGDAKRRLVAA